MPRTILPQTALAGLFCLSACLAADPARDARQAGAEEKSAQAEHAQAYIAQLHALEREAAEKGQPLDEFRAACAKLHYEQRDQASQPEQRLAAYRSYMPKWFTEMADDDRLEDYPGDCLRSLNDAYQSVQGHWKWEEVSYWTAKYVAEQHKSAFEAKGKELMAQQLAGPLHVSGLAYLTRFKGDKPQPAVRIFNRGDESVTGRYNIVVMDWHGRLLGEAKDLLVQLAGGENASLPIKLAQPYSAFPLVFAISPGRTIESLANLGIEPVHRKQALLLPPGYLDVLQNGRFASRFGHLPEQFAKKARCEEAWLTGDHDRYRKAVKRLATSWIDAAAGSRLPQAANYCKSIRELTLKYLATLPLSQEPELAPATNDPRISVEIRPGKSGKLYPVGFVRSDKPVRVDGRLFVKIFDGKTLMGEIERDLYFSAFPDGISFSSDGFYPIEGLTATVEAIITRWEPQPVAKGSF